MINLDGWQSRQTNDSASIVKRAKERDFAVANSPIFWPLVALSLAQVLNSHLDWSRDTR